MPDWSGTWRGPIIVSPSTVQPQGLELTLELGPFPTAAKNCTKWLGTYRKDGKVEVVKNYLLCRRNSDDDLYTDEQNGIILDTQWIGDTLVTPYKAFDVFYLVAMKLRGDILEEEIFTANDTALPGIQALRTTAVYRTQLKRVST